ncbi:hypothetical protein [Pararhodobacter sp.]|uniref:hypothetical protein n=1 Tax=Pararhodobacter sp. TaxID=2127056 RepID=UPI002FDE96A5
MRSRLNWSVARKLRGATTIGYYLAWRGARAFFCGCMTGAATRHPAKHPAEAARGEGIILRIFAKYSKERAELCCEAAKKPMFWREISGSLGAKRNGAVP